MSLWRFRPQRRKSGSHSRSATFTSGAGRLRRVPSPLSWAVFDTVPRKPRLERTATVKLSAVVPERVPVAVSVLLPDIPGALTRARWAPSVSVRIKGAATLPVFESVRVYVIRSPGRAQVALTVLADLLKLAGATPKR